jgi:predicted PolB exonuclease-like 3'-5' exonuclease
MISLAFETAVSNFMRYTSRIHFIGQRAVALGLPGKSGMDDSQVWDAVRDGRVDEVVQCNVDDIVRLRGVFSRLTFAPPAVEIAT